MSWYVLIWKDCQFSSPQVITTLSFCVFFVFVVVMREFEMRAETWKEPQRDFFHLETNQNFLVFLCHIYIRKLMWVWFFQNLSDLSGSTETNNGNQDNPSQDHHYHLVKSTQVCSSQSCEGTRKRVSVCGNRLVATMSTCRTELEQMVKAPHFTCEEQLVILQRYEEERKIHKRETQHSSSQKRRKTMSMCKLFRAHEVNVLCKPCV